jgi:hypothetical protein
MGRAPALLPLFGRWATNPWVVGPVSLGRPFRPKGTVFLIISPADFVEINSNFKPDEIHRNSNKFDKNKFNSFI